MTLLIDALQLFAAAATLAAATLQIAGILAKKKIVIPAR
jgi:hypothetical protein